VRIRLRLIFSLAAILVAAALPSYAGNDIRLLHEQLERIVRDNNAKLVVTSRAYREVKKKGVEHVQRLLVSRGVANDWIVLYTSDEDPDYISQLYKKNLSVWKSILDKSTLKDADMMLQVDLLGVEAAGVNQFMNKTCKTNLVLSKDAGKAPITVIGVENIRIDSLCEDYMLLVSVSKITVKRALNHVIGVID
jgi:hypothetical protein